MNRLSRWWLPILLTLLWTNPPDLDLSAIQFFAVKVGTTDTLSTGEIPLTYTQDDGTTYVRSQPGIPDSLEFSMPCMTDTTKKWNVWVCSRDVDDNWSGKSNIIQVGGTVGGSISQFQPQRVRMQVRVRGKQRVHGSGR